DFPPGRDVRSESSNVLVVDAEPPANEIGVGEIHGLHPTRQVSVGSLLLTASLELIGVTAKRSTDVSTRYPERRENEGHRQSITVVSPVVAEKGALAALPPGGADHAEFRFASADKIIALERKGKQSSGLGHTTVVTPLPTLLFGYLDKSLALLIFRTVFRDMPLAIA
ncbi:hypothetical protein GP486_007053, partial [Trichoglossum hirsutum]